MKYSIVVAVFNRPDEMDELLESLASQTYQDFEVVVVEDGSTNPSQEVCFKWKNQLQILYVVKENGGPGPARNYGCTLAQGAVFIYLDSDCTVPPNWLHVIDTEMEERGLQAFGGPDREHTNFTRLQKAISYAMTSVLTTGGIRGAKMQTAGTFHPRSFNMGLTRLAFDTTGGFAPMRFGEDVDLSIRLIQNGFKVGLIPDAWVYHKRRTDLKKFYRQVYNSGNARINLTVRHPGTLKLTHFFPAAITMYAVTAIIYTVCFTRGFVSLAPLVAYFAAISLHATLCQRSVSVGLLSTIAAAVQLGGYGLGFMRGLITRFVLGRSEEYAFKKSYYS